MATAGNTKKLFLDSRYKVEGTDADFLIELPVDVDCTRTSSFFLSSCSFANTYQTVTAFNNLLYFFMIIAGGVPGGGNPNVLFIVQIPPGTYTPETLAPALQTALGPIDTVTWQPAAGTYNIEFQQPGVLPSQYVIPNYQDIDLWFNFYHPDVVAPAGISYVPGVSKMQSINALLNMPVRYPAGEWHSFQTGVIDLSPMREVYLHCSLASNRTLHVNGARDCIARIPIDVGYGDVVAYRHLGPTDALSSSDVHFRTIRFQLRDWAGNLAPTGSFVVIELCFLDSDPYSA